MHKGLKVSVARTTRDYCTNNRISNRCDWLTIVGILRGLKLEPLNRYAQVFDATPDAPAVWLYHRWTGRDTWCLLPTLNGEPDTLHVTRWMFGGNYACPSDSRIAQIIDFYGGIAIHDWPVS